MHKTKKKVSILVTFYSSVPTQFILYGLGIRTSNRKDAIFLPSLLITKVGLIWTIHEKIITSKCYNDFHADPSA